MKFIRTVETATSRRPINHRGYRQFISVWVTWPDKKVGYLLYVKTPTKEAK